MLSPQILSRRSKRSRSKRLRLRLAEQAGRIRRRSLNNNMMRYIFSLVALFIAGAIFFWYTKPTYDSIQAIKDESAQYDAALQKASELQQLKQQLLQRYNSFLRRTSTVCRNLLPDHVDNVALILDLDNLAAKYQMPIENVDVSTPASTVGEDNNGQATIGASGQKYDSVTITLQRRARTRISRRFLNDLEQSLARRRSRSLTLTPTSGRFRSILMTYRCAPTGSNKYDKFHSLA
jgi:hypothetical protein